MNSCSTAFPVPDTCQVPFQGFKMHICCQHMEYLLVFVIRMAIPIRNFIKNSFFASLTHVASQPGAFLRLALSPWPKENNMVHNYRAGSQRWTISYCLSLWPTHKQEVAICLPRTGSKPQSVTVTHHQPTRLAKASVFKRRNDAPFPF